MSNEEKILELLGKMNERMEVMEGKITGMEKRITNIETNMATKDETREIRILIEYDIMEKLNLLSEGHQMLENTKVPIEEAIEQKEEITFIKNMLEVLADRVKHLEKAG